MIYLLLGAAVLAGVVGASFWVYRQIFYAPAFPKWVQRQAVQQTTWREQESLPFETVSILSREGLTLRGRLYPGEGPALLCVPEPGAEAGLKVFLRIALHLGFAVLVTDPRGQGDSQGRTFSFGLRERLDLLGWVDFALEKLGDRDLYLYGLGSGGATVLLTGDFPLGQNIRGLIADSPYDTPMGMVKLLGEKLGWPSWLFCPLATLGARLFGGFDLKESSPLQALEKSEVPTLLLCGESDTFTPPQMSQDLLSAAPQHATLFTFPGAGHCKSCAIDPVRYGAIVGQFVRKNQR